MTGRLPLRQLAVLTLATAGFTGGCAGLAALAHADGGLGLPPAPTLSPSPTVSTTSPLPDVNSLLAGATASPSPSSSPSASPSPSPSPSSTASSPAPSPSPTPSGTQGAAAGGTTGSVGPGLAAGAAAGPVTTGAKGPATKLDTPLSPPKKPLFDGRPLGGNTPGGMLPAEPPLSIPALLDPLPAAGQAPSTGVPPLLADGQSQAAPDNGGTTLSPTVPTTVLRTSASRMTQPQPDLFPSLLLTALVAFGLGLGARRLIINRRRRRLAAARPSAAG